MLAIFNKNIMGGASIAAWGPCATAHLCKSTDKVVDYGTKGIEKMRIYIWGGKLDTLTGTDAPKQTAAWFKNYTSAVVEEYPDCGHTWTNALPPTKYNPRGDCSKGGMINSNDDIAGRTLAQVMNETMKPWNLDYNKNGQLYMYDQSEYFVGDHKMYTAGFVYIPEYCLTNTCKSHMWFHGCGGTFAWLGTQVMRATGILEHASANNFIAFFPQTDNPYEDGCWAADLTQQKDHPQLQTIRKTLQGFFDRDVLEGDDEAEQVEFLQE